MKTKMAIITIAIVTLLMNLHLLGFSFPSNCMFHPEDFTHGQWYRIITYAWIHVSWYHLLVDLGAFLILIYCLNTKSTGRKIFYTLSCMIGAALFSVNNPIVYKIGLCGLSGTAHGLMTICLLENMHIRQNRKLALMIFVLFITKCIYESFTGLNFFADWHLGNVGNPVTICHAGGAIAGITVFYIFRLNEIYFKDKTREIINLIQQIRKNIATN